MNINKKVAVIGAGIFGCEVALTLQRFGYDVVLFEKSSSIFNGATTNSQNRLHLGLHYPRDLQTALQSVRGYTSFSERFPNSVDTSFENYYALASQDSKINLSQFKTFLSNSGIGVTEVDRDALAAQGLSPNDITGLWLCKEGVIDFSSLRNQLENEIQTGSMELSLSNEVISLEQMTNQVKLKSPLRDEENFDFVVRSTYGSDRIQIVNSTVPKRIYEFHHTIIVKAKTSLARKGITIIDGDFLTLLPYGRTSESLLYTPTGSVRDKFEGVEYPKDWDLVSNNEFVSKETEIIDRFNSWLPNLEIHSDREYLITVRSIQPNVQNTDRRTSEVTQMSRNIIDIWSGKIDHCVDIAEDVARIIGHASES